MLSILKKNILLECLKERVVKCPFCSDHCLYEIELPRKRSVWKPVVISKTKLYTNYANHSETTWHQNIKRVVQYIDQYEADIRNEASTKLEKSCKSHGIGPLG